MQGRAIPQLLGGDVIRGLEINALQARAVAQCMHSAPQVQQFVEQHAQFSRRGEYTDHDIQNFVCLVRDIFPSSLPHSAHCWLRRVSPRADRCDIDDDVWMSPSQFEAYQQYFTAVLGTSRRAWVHFDEPTIVSGLCGMVAVIIIALAYFTPGTDACAMCLHSPARRVGRGWCGGWCGVARHSGRCWICLLHPARGLARDEMVGN